jgi:protein subunit release factor A
MKLLLEIRPGEGGDDAKLLVEEQASIYLRSAQHLDVAAEMVEIAPAACG